MQENNNKDKNSNINVNVFFDEKAEPLNTVIENLILNNCNPLKNL